MTDFDTQVTGSGTVIRTRGRLDLVAAPALKALITETVHEVGATVVVDLSETEFMDSSGLGALIAGLRSARQAGGDLRIACVAPQVAAVLKMTNIDRILRPHSSVREALDGT